MGAFVFYDRDLSWLSFNERVLLEADKIQVPLMERIRFLSIYSSNLDEFYRVRMPAILALERIQKETFIYQQASDIITRQLNSFGKILTGALIPALRECGVHLVYNEYLPLQLVPAINEYFYHHVAAFIQPVLLEGKVDFFPENNQLYVAAVVQQTSGIESIYIINIPVSNISRFLKFEVTEISYIIFLEDVVKQCLKFLFPGKTIDGAYNVKITRDAELDLLDEYEGDLAEKMEKQLTRRDAGLATRFLYEPGIPLRHLQKIIKTFSLHEASIVEGGSHHNLKDLAQLPISMPEMNYPAWPSIHSPVLGIVNTLFEKISQQDVLINVPYHSYDTVLRFFNEAAIDERVTEIYTTLYRVASDSRIGFALISAAKNGKKVSVVVELKARFDEANNIRWAKRMKAAGVRIIYSINALKVHAKIALIKRNGTEQPYLGLLATGNLNESTARFYTDHILLTAYQPMLLEMNKLFGFLSKRKKPGEEDKLHFKHLLVAQFNLLQRFTALIDREIRHAAEGISASITIKLNNLEEERLISKLYEASNAGVRIQLIVRGICRLVPGVAGQSEHISVIRIIDRYLEHGRVFIFHNNGSPEVYLGSADWMNRNIYRRIEVCFPVYSEDVRKQLISLIDLQLNDSIQAVRINNEQNNEKVPADDRNIRSQEAIYKMLAAL
ncbi:MAG: polyphosphate kinase 1 [Chitinophagaceae bacterium]|nr:polyphosphate kinase 1 [Chitinophagaceae bacterium]